MDIDPAVYHDLLRSAAQRLTGHQRRLFQAEVAQALCRGSARQAERLFGWGRQSVALGQQEAVHGVRCQEDFAARGLKPREERDPQLARDIRDLAEPHTQADPQMNSALKYTRLTADALRRIAHLSAAVDRHGEREDHDLLLPHPEASLAAAIFGGATLSAVDVDRRAPARSAPRRLVPYRTLSATPGSPRRRPSPGERVAARPGRIPGWCRG